jgi:hypothetical protein
MVEEDQIPKLLKTAELLEIRGLADLTTLNEVTESHYNSEKYTGKT